MSIHNAIDTIRKRPGMYLGSKSITALSHFLNGYRFAEIDYEVKRIDELLPLNFKFMHEFTKIKLRNDDNSGWCNQILQYCKGDEEKALDEFLELYDEFRQVKMKRYWKTILTEENIQYNNSMEHAYMMRMNVKEPVFVNPVAIYIVELTIPAYMVVVETTDGMQPVYQFFSSYEQAKGGNVPSGAERYFGKINLWEEYVGQNVAFGESKCGRKSEV